MNYYEYAPWFLKWLHYTGIKPWQLFTLIFWGSLLVAPLLFSASFVKTYKKRTRIILFTSSFILLIWGTRLDKYYLNYEQEKICGMPAIYIKNQVSANGYIEISHSRELDKDEIESIINTSPIGEDIWIEKDFEYCEHVTKYQGYHFGETAGLSSNSGQLRFADDFDYLDLSGLGKKKKYRYNIKFRGVKDDICYQAYLNKPRARYYLITNIGPKRLGLGIKRYKSMIYDSLTGEEVAYSNMY